LFAKRSNPSLPKKNDGFLIFVVDSLRRHGIVIICSGLKLYLVSPLKSKTLDRSTGVILVENQYGDNWNKSNNDFMGG
jgi:hypothetical protein